MTDTDTEGATPFVPPPYPWRLWLDGDAHVITRGWEYSISTRSMVQSLRSRAHRERLGVEIKASSDEIYFVFHPLDSR